MKQRIYLDNNSTTPLDPRVVETIHEALLSQIGNPSSIHSFGQEAKSQLLKARQIISTFFHVRTNEIIFTSGATEGLNSILKGLFQDSPHGHLITSDLEHSSVYATAQSLQKKGTSVTFLSPGLKGAVTPDQVEKSIKPETKLIALMAVNNETGVKTDINAIAKIAEELKIPFLVDGVALLGKELFTIPSGVTAMCFSGHKLHAPKGVGFSFIRSHFKFPSLITGGEQEFNRRGGTENLSGILGLAKAIDLLNKELPSASTRMNQLRNQFEVEIQKHLPGVFVNGEGERVVNTSHLAFSDIDGESLLTLLDMQGLAASHGSACSSGALEPSRVLLKMGIPIHLARSSIRFSLSRFTTPQEIEKGIEIVIKSVRQLRTH